MVERLQDRRVTVYAQDAQRTPLTGAVFTFSVEGTEYGTVESSTGRADITVPGAEARPLTVSARYKDQQQTVKIAADQITYTFTFRSVASMSSRITGPLVWGFASLGVVLAAAIGLLFFYHPRPPLPVIPPDQDSDERRAQSIARVCAGGSAVVNESAVGAELTTAVKKAKAGATVTSQDVGAIIQKIAPDQTGLAFYQAYTKCIADNLAKVQAQAPQSKAPDTLSVPSVPGELRGWSYYEEQNGRPTGDGVLMPANAQPAPAYPKVSKGLILRSRRGFKIRVKPGGSEDIVAQPGAARCVMVLGPPSHAVKVSDATSGGWLEVALTRCPDSPE